MNKSKKMKKRVTALVLSLVMVIAYMPLTDWVAEETKAASKELSFSYAYDCQRSPAYPAKDDSVKLSGFKGALDKQSQHRDSIGSWKLALIGKYDSASDYSEGETTKCTVSTIVNSMATQYQIGAEKLQVWSLSENDTIICYGVLVASFSDGSVFFIGTTWSGGAGYYFCDKELSSSDTVNETVTSDCASMSIEVSSNSIEVSDLDANYMYSLTDEDGNRLTEWMTPDEELKIVFENLESDTKYKLIAASKDVENKDEKKQDVSDVSTALDPVKKTEEGKEVIFTPSMTSISFKNLNKEYTYCLQDENKKIVKSWTTTSDGAITFDDLLPETEYYLVAKSSSNAMSDRVLYRTLDATDEYKIETAKQVTTETLAKYTAKNETTKKILVNEIKEALSNNRFTQEIKVEIAEWNMKGSDVDNEGSITGKVVLSNSLSREVIINKEIAKKTEAEIAKERVGDAKRAVENILADMTVTNVVTKGAIDAEIKRILDGKGFTDVTITVNDITVENATNEKEGKVTGTIVISKSTVSVSVNVNKEIAKLPKDEQEKIQQVVADSVIKDITSEVVTEKGTDITQVDVKNAVSAQLSEKGVEGAEITISNFTKKEGTATSQGFVKGTVNVTKDDVTETVAFKQVLPATEQSYKVSGKILDENEAAMGGVIVKLMQGNVEIASSISKSNTGEYEFENLPVGVYNIVASTGNIKKTQKVVITTANETVDVKLPGEGVRSNLEVKDNVVENSSFIAQAVVGGLDKEAIAVAETVKSSNPGKTIDVDVKMNIEAKASQDFETEKKAEKDAIDNVSKVSSARKAEYFDIKVNKTTSVNGQKESQLMSQTNRVMEIIIPFDMKDKYNIVPYRYHNGSVNVFSKRDTKEDGTYKVDENNQFIYIYTQKFSTYAIGYDIRRPGGGSSSGSGSYYYPVTGINLSTEKATMTKFGETLQLTAEISPSYATNKNITWTSDKEAVAIVDSTGKVTAVGNGTATITVTTQNGNKTATSVITVNITPTETDTPSVPTGTDTPTAPSGTDTPIVPTDTDKPIILVTPEPTVLSETDKPIVSVTPVITATPIVIVTPEVSTTSVEPTAPAGTDVPKDTATPEDTVAPEVTATPKVTSTPKPNVKVVSDFGTLKARSEKQTQTTITLKWTKVSDADGYLIYGSKCNSKDVQYTRKLIKTIKGNSTLIWTQKKLEKATYYKYKIKAYKLVDGKKVIIAQSVGIHAATKGGKHCVASAVKVTKLAGKKVSGTSLKLTIAKGKNAQITVSETPAEKNKTIHYHRAICYETSNSKVATVTKSGKIKAVGEGTCKIWVYAQNGVYKTITITVK